MNRLSTQKRTRIVAALVEGCSIRATARMTGCSKNTATKLLADLGKACAKYQDRVLRDLPCKRVQLDEIWSFCYARRQNVPEDKRGVFGFGDVWTWTAICADTKLVPSWMVGERTTSDALNFVSDLAWRLTHRVQVTTDGLSPYIVAVPYGFKGKVDFGVLEKWYGHEQGSNPRRGPVRCIGTRKVPMHGTPKNKHISTSYVERQNLTMRMGIRRFTRLTNGFSKKVQNLEHAVALHFMHYNFSRVHMTLRATPAMAAGVTDRLWEIEDIVRLLDKDISN